MTEKELKGLSRADLLDLLIAESKKVQQLEEELEQVKEMLVSREISLANAGSIAEAALQLNGVFEAAQAAAAQYVENVTRLSQQQEAECAIMEQECRERVERQLAETQKTCEEMVAAAERESKAYWDDVSQKLDAFYHEHAGLKQLLSVLQRG